MKKYRTDKEWEELIHRQEISGQSIVSFSKKEGIHPNLFYKKRRDFASSNKTDQYFVEVKTAKKSCLIIDRTLIKIGSIEIYPAAGLDPRELLTLLQTAMEASGARIWK